MAKDKILLGKIDNENIYLYKHSWDCGWYWGMGYIGNKNCQYHIKSLIQDKYDVNKIFSSTKLTQAQWWIVRDLFVQAYALKKVAEVYKSGGYQSSLKGITDKLVNADKAAIANADLAIILDTIWEYINQCLT